MEKKIRYQIYIVCIILIQCALWIWCGAHKEGYNFDELMIYHYASIMFDDTENRVDFQNQTNFYNMNHSNQEFMDTLSVLEGNGFWEQPVSVQGRTIRTADTYTVFLNMLMSAFDGRFNKWYCIALNILFFIIVQWSLYKLSYQICADRRCATMTIMFYGFSIAAGKPVLFLRFYELFILIALLYAVVGISMYTKEKLDWIFFLKIVLTMILTLYGYYNAEYMIVFAFTFSVAFVIACLLKKQWRKAIAYCACYGLGAIAFLVKFWGRFVKQYYSDESQLFFAVNQILGGEIKAFFKYVVLYTSELLFDTGVGIIFLAFLIGLIIRRITHKRNQEKYNVYWWIILFTCVGYLLIISKIAPWIAWRYGTVMGPFFVVLACTALWGILKQTEKRKIAIGLLICAQWIYFIAFNHVGGVVTGEVKDAIHEQINEQYADYNGIMFSTNDRGDLYFAAYMWPENGKMYVTSTEMIEEDTRDKQEILKDDKLLVWARSEETWNDEIEPIMNSYGYMDNKMVIDTGEARFLVYLCKR